MMVELMNKYKAFYMYRNRIEYNERMLQAYEKIFIRRGFMALMSWGGLGFYRGVQEYNYEYEFKSEKYKRENPKMYISAFGAGFIGTLMYVNPFGIVWSIPGELYRLEVNLRGLEKTSRYYRIYA